MITYNHESFIVQAIESVLMQQADFPIELVIGEDCSTDGTRRIVEHYARLRPDIIRPLLHQKNQGTHGNFCAVLSQCRGEFIAFLEGDDYWTSAHKLQKQADSLQSIWQSAFTCHATRIVNANNTELQRMFPPQQLLADKKLSTALVQIDVLQPCTVVTCSVLLRRELINIRTLVEFRESPALDVPIFVLACSSNRTAHFSAEVMASYREHAGGVTKRFSKPETLYKLGQMYELLSKKVDSSAQSICKEHSFDRYLGAARGFADTGQLWESLCALSCSMKQSNQAFHKFAKTFGVNFARTIWRCARQFQSSNRRRLSKNPFAL